MLHLTVLRNEERPRAQLLRAGRNSNGALRSEFFEKRSFDKTMLRKRSEKEGARFSNNLFIILYSHSYFIHTVLFINVINYSGSFDQAIPYKLLLYPFSPNHFRISTCPQHDIFILQHFMFNGHPFSYAHFNIEK